MRVAILVVVAIAAAAWIASRSMLSPSVYDSGLYHLNTIRWINTFPIVPGLGNLHGRLAFNQAFFTYAASLNFVANGSRIANSFLFLLAATTFLARLRPVIARPSLLADSHPFEFLPSLFALPILGYLALLSTGLSSPTPDLASELLQLVMFAMLARVVLRWSTGEDVPIDETATLAILATTAITIKLSNLAFSAVVVAIALAIERASKRPHVPRAMPTSAAGRAGRVIVVMMVVMIVWIARGYVSSGAPLYPSTIAYVAFDWAVPREEVTQMASLIRGWARQPGDGWRTALDDWSWLRGWTRRFHEHKAILYSLRLGTCLLAACVVIAWMKRSRLRELIVLVPVLAGLAFWFLTAPDPRFAHALFSCFAIAAALLLLAVIHPWAPRRTFTLILIAGFAVTHWGLALQTLRERAAIGKISITGWQPIPRVPLIPRTTASGLVVLTPAEGDRCWDAPLPCTPYFREDLKTRVPGRLESGFSVKPRGSLRKNITTVLNLKNFGAAGDGMSDDGPALQRALNALATFGGGTLYIPPGSYAIMTAVSKDFSVQASSVTIAGEDSRTTIDLAGNGSGLSLKSEFIIKVGKEQIALSFKGLDALLIRDIAFAGVEEVADDAHVVLKVDAINDVRVEHCEFYGLASLEPGGSIVAAHESGLKVERTAFLGCTTNSAHNAPVIENLAWKDIAITNTKFIDYGTHHDFSSKTQLAPPYSWIGIGDAQTAQPGSSRRDAVIRNVFLDEGAVFGISARPDLHSRPSAPFNVFISTVRMNVTNLGASGIYLQGVDQVLIEKSHFGWSHNADAAIVLKGVHNAILDRIECVDHANTIRADADTQRVVVIDSIYDTLDSAAPYTKTLKTRNPMDDPVQYVRKAYLDALRTEPELQALHFWADQMLRCEGDASCSAEKRAAMAESLATHARRRQHSETGR